MGVSSGTTCIYGYFISSTNEEGGREKVENLLQKILLKEGYVIKEDGKTVISPDGDEENIEELIGEEMDFPHFTFQRIGDCLGDCWSSWFLVLSEIGISEYDVVQKISDQRPPQEKIDNLKSYLRDLGISEEELEANIGEYMATWRG